MKKIVVVNGGPRPNYNTGRLLDAAAQGAREAGAEIVRFDLYRLEKHTGCISCFACKREASYGRCAVRDGLAPVLDAIRDADGLIMGSPNYLSEMTAGFRALYERLIFQSLTYREERPCCNERRIPVLFITTSNAPDSFYERGGMYCGLIERYKDTLGAFVGPTEALVAADTRQVKDYSPYGWTFFDAEAKIRRDETVFPGKIAEARAAGGRMALGARDSEQP